MFDDLTAVLIVFAAIFGLVALRVATLERILDSEVPSWRDNQAEFYQLASK